MGDKMSNKPKVAFHRSVGDVDYTLEKLLQEKCSYKGYDVVFSDVGFTVNHDTKTITFKPVLEMLKGDNVDMGD
jgi:hypothetical protein